MKLFPKESRELQPNRSSFQRRYALIIFLVLLLINNNAAFAADDDDDNDDDTDGRHDPPSGDNQFEHTPSASPVDISSNRPSSPQFPSNMPSLGPSHQASLHPTETPSFSPTSVPSSAPTKIPTSLPSTSPSEFPSIVTSMSPSKVTSMSPSISPSMFPSALPSTSPMANPSLQPSLRQTGAPSQQPTIESKPISPSSSPSTAVSINPSRSLTANPSQQPTIASFPTTSPMKRPSLRPSTRSPSQNPSRQPSIHPTIAPSQQPTISSLPTIDPCITNSSGFFGQTTTSEVLINYNYQLQYSNSSADTSIDDILPALEAAIGKLMIHSTFTECKTDSSGDPMSSSSMEDAVVGIGSLRNRVATENSCQAQQTLSSAVDCDVIEGRLSLFLRDGGLNRRLVSSDEIEVRNETIAIIRGGMESGELTKAHPDIRGIFFLDGSTTGRNVDDLSLVNRSKEEEEISSKQLPIYGWALILCGAALVAGLVGRQGKKCIQQRKEEVMMRSSSSLTEGEGSSKDSPSEYDSDVESNQSDKTLDFRT